jgi:hypothetical protein
MGADHICDRIIPNLRRGQFVRLRGVRVDRKRDARVGMRETFHDRRDRDAGAEQLTGVGMAQRMKTDALQPCLLHQFNRAGAPAVRTVIASLRSAENEIRCPGSRRRTASGHDLVRRGVPEAPLSRRPAQRTASAFLTSWT